ncbi:MAG: gliding motility-associated ABC transporter ATP-binding subunit GldA [Bacteroidales bacterium]|jgi:ABC-2 type transport system ATP-binding protein|nr:gliding motility-associated ABC transporter ATP-binding subunit GldA [Bacteroidales bacterium]
MSIVVEHVTKLYGEQRALDNVSFSVEPGEIVGLLGPNGAGKSTIMKIITCFIPQNEGSVSVCGFNVQENALEVKKRIGYLPEHNPLYPDMYVREYLEFIAKIHKVNGNINKRIDEMIYLTGLMPERKKKIGALSKGYRQRVGLAQALIHDPDVLIMDEPTSGLDPNQLVGIRELITQIGKEKTVILSTHIMQEAEAMCTRTIIINKGKIVANAPTCELTQAALGSNRIVVEFNGKIEHNKLRAISGVVHVEKISDVIWSLTAQTSKDVRKSVFDLAVAEKLAVLSMKIEQRKLEDIFHQLTTQNNKD